MLGDSKIELLVRLLERLHGRHGEIAPKIFARLTRLLVIRHGRLFKLL
jgi:hypothetical protein